MRMIMSAFGLSVSLLRKTVLLPSLVCAEVLCLLYAQIYASSQVPSDYVKQVPGESVYGRLYH